MNKVESEFIEELGSLSDEISHVLSKFEDVRWDPAGVVHNFIYEYERLGQKLKDTEKYINVFLNHSF